MQLSTLKSRLLKPIWIFSVFLLFAASSSRLRGSGLSPVISSHEIEPSLDWRDFFGEFVRDGETVALSTRRSTTVATFTKNVSGSWEPSETLSRDPAFDVNAIAAGDGFIAINDGGKVIRLYRSNEDGIWEPHSQIPRQPTGGFYEDMVFAAGRLAIASPQDSGAGQINGGSVRIYRPSGAEWILEDTLRPTSETTEPRFGTSLISIGTSIFVGGNDIGIHEFRLSGDSLVKHGTLQSGDTRPSLTNPNFGRSLSRAGDTLLVGSVGQFNRLQTEVFRKNDDGDYSYLQTIPEANAGIGSEDLLVFDGGGNRFASDNITFYTQGGGGLWHSSHTRFDGERDIAQSFGVATLITESGAFVGSLTDSFTSKKTQVDVIDISRIPVTGEPATIEIVATDKPYDGTPLEISVETDPPGLDTCISIARSNQEETSALPATYRIEASIVSAGYVGTTFADGRISKASQSLVVGQVPPLAVGEEPFPLSYSSTSGLPPVFTSLNPAVASVSEDGRISANAPGAAVISAIVPDSDLYKSTGTSRRVVSVALGSELSPFKIGSIFRANWLGSNLSLSLYREQLVIGKRASAFETPSVRIFRWLGDGRWELETGLETNDSESNLGFGSALSFGREGLLIGSPETIHSEEGEEGAVYWYEKPEGGQWSEEQRFIQPEGAGALEFGAKLDYEGRTAVISAPGGSGMVFVYTRDSNNRWGTPQTLVPSASGEADQFGSSIDLSGNVLVVGASGDPNSEVAYIFERDASGNWLESAKLESPEGATRSGFGNSVGTDGVSVLISAPTISIGELGSGRKGEVYVFEKNDAGVWALGAELAQVSESKFSSLGNGLAVSGGTAVVKATLRSTSGREPKAYFATYRKSRENGWEAVGIMVGDQEASSGGGGISLSFGRAATGDLSGIGNQETTTASIYDTGLSSPDGVLSVSGNVATFDGSAQQIRISSSRPESDYEILYNGNSQPPTSGGIYDVTISDRLNPGTPAFETSLTILRLPQESEIFLADKRLAVGETTTLRLELSSGLGGAIFESLHPDVASYSNGIVTAHEPGNCIFKIKHPGNENYVETEDLYVKLLVDVPFPSTYTPVTSTVEKEGGNRVYGSSVSISGGLAVIGSPAPFADDNLGKALVLSENFSGEWSEVASLVPSPEPAAGSGYGKSVAISGSTVIVSAPDTENGDVYIFESDLDGGWTQVAHFTGEEENAEFGHAVALKDDIAVVGAPGASDKFGSATVIRRGRDGTWDASPSFKPPGIALPSYFGFAVDIKDGLIACGDPFDPEGGAVYLFTVDPETGGVEERVKLQAADVQPGDRFGYAVAIRDAEEVFVGSPLRSCSGPTRDCGGVFRFSYDAASSGWLEDPAVYGLETASDGQASGSSLSISGDRILVGYDGQTSRLNRALLYRIGESGSPILEQRLQVYGSRSGSHFGKTVALSESRAIVSDPVDIFSANVRKSAYFFRLPRLLKGAKEFVAKDEKVFEGLSASSLGMSVASAGVEAVVGAPTSAITGVDSGAVHIYGNSGTESAPSWIETEVLENPASNPESDLFGISVGMTSSCIVVGAPGRDGSFALSGGADIFSKNALGEWEYVQSLVPNDPAEGAIFGRTVAISGETIVVGAPFFSGANEQAFLQGAIYVFERDSSGRWIETFTWKGSPGSLLGLSIDVRGWSVLAGAPGAFEDSIGVARLFRFNPVAGWDYSRSVQWGFRSGSGKAIKANR